MNFADRLGKARRDKNDAADTLSQAEARLAISTAVGEQEVIDALNGKYGSNPEERKRTLILGLAGLPDYHEYNIWMIEVEQWRRLYLRACLEIDIILDQRRDYENSLKEKSLEQHADAT
jgi:hypothetical protein